MMYFALKSDIFNIFKQNVIFIIYYHIYYILPYLSNMRPLNIKKMCKIMEYIMPLGRKSVVINIIS